MEKEYYQVEEKISWAPLYKGEINTKNCFNYKSLKMLEHAIKILQRVFENRIWQNVQMSQVQLKFMFGKCTINAHHLYSQITYGKDFFCYFWIRRRLLNAFQEKIFGEL